MSASFQKRYPRQVIEEISQLTSLDGLTKVRSIESYGFAHDVSIRNFNKRNVKVLVKTFDLIQFRNTLPRWVSPDQKEAFVKLVKNEAANIQKSNHPHVVNLFAFIQGQSQKF